MSTETKSPPPAPQPEQAKPEQAKAAAKVDAKQQRGPIRPLKYSPTKGTDVPPVPPEKYADVGMVVLHYPDDSADCRAACAIVTARGHAAIDLAVQHPGISGSTSMPGVSHRSDYRAEFGGDGLWEHQPIFLVMLRKMIASGDLVWDGESRYVPKQSVNASTAGSAPST